MLALIIGASSGIGADMARILSKQGHNLILVARRKDKLEKLKKELKTEVEIISMDMSTTFNCMKLYNKIKNKEIDIVINNAGFGIFGDFTETNLDEELDMIDLNIKAIHTLTKLFLIDFKKRNNGYILNVSSLAAFQPGPMMATYYATKSYIYNITAAIYEELRQSNSNVYVGALCPGPVKTEFNKRANVKFAIKALDSKYVAEYAINQMFKRKLIIVPGFKIKLTKFATSFVPLKTKLKIAYSIQKRKRK